MVLGREGYYFGYCTESARFCKADMPRDFRAIQNFAEWGFFYILAPYRFFVDLPLPENSMKSVEHPLVPTTSGPLRSDEICARGEYQSEAYSGSTSNEEHSRKRKDRAPQGLPSTAFRIARTALEKCYDRLGIVAGRRHFGDLWARDFLFASWGALVIGDTDIVRTGLITLADSTLPSGQLPLRIGCSSLGQVRRLFGLRADEEVRTYAQDKRFSHPQDQNSLFLITLARYLDATGDVSILEHCPTDRLRAICAWNISETRDGLLFGGGYATWQDSVRKPGWTLMNNVLYIESFRALSAILAYAGETAPTEWAECEATSRTRLREHLWNGQYYSDYHDGTARRDIFSLDGNLFAIYWDIVTPDERESILAHLASTNLLHPFGARTNTPAYRLSEVYLPYALIGMDDYQNNSFHWLWLGCLAAMVLARSDREAEAHHTLANIARVIEEYGDVYEVYERHGKPVRRLWYVSEHPFAWSSGFFVAACREVYGELPHVM